MAYEAISVFDIFKICIGPSSSHTMGPWVAANTFVDNIDLDHLQSLRVTLYGSLSQTGKGHGTDIAVLLGLCGHNVKTIAVDSVNDEIAHIYDTLTLNVKGKIISFDPAQNVIFSQDTLKAHANALTFEAFFTDGSSCEATFYSIGGGFVLQEGVKKSKAEQKTLPYPVNQAQDLLDYLQENPSWSIADLVFANELALNDEATIDENIEAIWQVMLHCIYKGCHSQGILPGGLEVKRRAFAMHKKLIGESKYDSVQSWIKLIQQQSHEFNNIIQWVSCFALAVNEENASFGRVVTAPTNGAAGVIPAVLMYYLCFCPNDGGKDLHKFLFTASEMGSLFKKGATISAAMGGCQAEIGVSSAMAAGALTERLGGSVKQTMMATEIAMEHHLGMTCDPIMGLVQIPCIERNTMGAIKAITASQMALAGDPSTAKVSLDNVIKTMKQTADDMQTTYKETALAGLAVNVPVSVSEC